MDNNVVTPSVFYRDRATALPWLERAFGFEITMAIDGPADDPAMGHYEMSCGGAGRIVIAAEWASWTRSPVHFDGANTQIVEVRLAEGLDEHCSRAQAAGATIVEAPADQFYGDRKYRALDLEGHCWAFVMHVRDVTKAEAEAAIGQPITASSWP